MMIRRAAFALDQKGAIGAWLLVLGALTLSIGGFFAVRWLTRAPDSAPTTEKRAVVTVGLAKAKYGSISETLDLNGTVEARDRLKVGTEVGGLKIVEVLVEEGDYVRRGQLLARLNTDIAQARLGQLQARYDQQTAALAKARQPQRPLEVAQLESALRQSETMIQQEEANARLVKAAYQNAVANVNRYQNLYDSGAVPATEAENRRLEADRQKAQLQGAENRIDSAKFAARQARERLQLAQQGGRTEDVDIVQAQLRELNAQMDEVRVSIGQGRIVAPADGWVLKREAHLGDIAGNGSVLFELAKNGELELLGKISETQVHQIQVGQSVVVRHSGETLEAKVWKISPVVNELDRNAEVRIALPNNSGLKPGMFAEATVALGDVKAITVPLEAVRGESPSYYVFTLNGDVAKKQPVTVTGRQGGGASVSRGLTVGQEVVTEGGGFLRDGDTVARP